MDAKVFPGAIAKQMMDAVLRSTSWPRYCKCNTNLEVKFRSIYMYIVSTYSIMQDTHINTCSVELSLYVYFQSDSRCVYVRHICAFQKQFSLCVCSLHFMCISNVRRPLVSILIIDGLDILPLGGDVMICYGGCCSN